MSYLSYASCAKNQKMNKLEILKVHFGVRNKMRYHGVPQEIIDLIFSLVFPYSRRKLFRQIRRMKDMRSIWWDPSDRLKELCGGRGSIQLDHFDLWTIFPAFVKFKRHEGFMKRLPPFVEQRVEEVFKDKMCHSDEYTEIDGCCVNCILYDFPCLNYCHEHEPECKVSHLWNIQDEPVVREVLEEVL
jgi:hypothetical protein